MRTWIRRSLIALSTIAALAGATVLAGVALSERKLDRKVALPPLPVVEARSDAAALARGEYLYRSRGCADCHGTDGAGRLFIDSPDGMRVRGANLTTGAGSAVRRYGDLDWQRAIRHGVKPDGRPLFVMPSEDYAGLTDADLGALIGHLRSLAPVDTAPARFELPLLVRVLYGFGAIPDAAQKIDHARPAPQPVAEAISAEHGGYVAQSCIGCHGRDFSGGRVAGGPPDWPAASDLRPGPASAMARYRNADEFVAMLRSGKRPDGSAVSPVMPFAMLRELSDVDARAMYTYFTQALPPVATLSR